VPIFIQRIRVTKVGELQRIEVKNKNLLFNTQWGGSEVRDSPIIEHKRVTCQSSS